MGAAIQRKRFGGGSIRLGRACFQWGDDYTRSLSFEVVRVNIAVLGGLNWRLSRDEYRWLEEALIREGLRAAMERVLRDKFKRPLRDKNGKPITRFVICAMPKLRNPPKLLGETHENRPGADRPAVLHAAGGGAEFATAAE